MLLWKMSKGVASGSDCSALFHPFPFFDDFECISVCAFSIRLCAGSRALNSSFRSKEKERERSPPPPPPLGPPKCLCDKKNKSPSLWILSELTKSSGLLGSVSYQVRVIRVESLRCRIIISILHCDPLFLFFVLFATKHS